MLLLFLKAFIIWLWLSIPTWPVWVLCIKDTLNKSRVSGLITGLWASLGDFVYTFVVVVGMQKIIVFLHAYTLVIKIVAFGILLALGLHTFFKKVPKEHTMFSFRSWVKAFFSSFFLVITSPGVLLSFVIAFSYLGIMVEGVLLSIGQKALILWWVLAWSVVRWYLLSWVTHRLRNKVPDDILHKVNKISGVILIFFAVLIMFYDVILKFFS